MPIIQLAVSISRFSHKLSAMLLALSLAIIGTTTAWSQSDTETGKIIISGASGQIGGLTVK